MAGEELKDESPCLPLPYRLRAAALALARNVCRRLAGRRFSQLYHAPESRSAAQLAALTAHNVALTAGNLALEADKADLVARIADQRTQLERL